MEKAKARARKVAGLRKLRWKDVKNYWINDGPKAVFILLFFLANFAVIAERFVYYKWIHTDPFDVLGWALIFARCSGAALKINCAILLIPVLRNFLSWVRGTWVGTYIPVDKALVFHRKIAWIIAFYSVVHVTAHYVNYNTIENYDDLVELKEKLLHDLDGDPPSALLQAWATIPGATGHAICLIMAFIFASAVESVRRPYFEAFWYTHHLFFLFYALLCVHGAARLLEPPTFWAWMLGPAVAYVVERTVRMLRGKQDTILQLAIQHPSKVVELQMRKAKFEFKAGQYLFLNCPYIAAHEWHPFTISSAPEEPFVSVHIRIVGDWTGKLYNLLNPDKQLGIVRQDMLTSPDGSPILKIDGPYGAASEDIFKFETVILIGAGIGVTPFASILKTIRYRIEAQVNSGTVDMPVTKVYFYWVCREKNAFEWFFDLLSALEAENVNNFLEIHAYLTSLKAPPEDKIPLLEGEEEGEEGRDPITGLRSGTHYGRPNFDEIFQSKTEQHPNEHIGVFFCGPSVLSKQLYKLARKYTKVGTTKFHYHKENF